MYKVPEFVVGMPIYNGLECVKYVVRALKKNGFYVKYTHPNLLYISWDKIPESHYPSSRKKTVIKTEKISKPDNNTQKYRDITDREHNLPYNSNIMNSLEGRLRDIMRPN
tara:strand:+ start:841 stop:1170 length:330 start_codon:yes stop_codon:yes gene_type:complete